MDAVEFKQVSKSYKLPNGQVCEALKSFSLAIPKGEFFGLLGHNGAGKTSAINILAGVNKATQGEIFIHGKNVNKDPEFTKRIIGVVQQELLVDSFFSLPVMLNIQSRLYGVAPDKEWIEFILEKLSLNEHRKKTTRELSGGMKRRMMIARALVHKPAVLVLDEPTAGVDVQLRHNMWEFIQELHGTGMTIILTTHYLEEAENFCSRIGIMKNGELVTLKRNKELLSLGGKPKFEFILLINAKQIDEKLLFLIKEQYAPSDVHIEILKTTEESENKKIKISAQMDYENFESTKNYFEKTMNIVAQYNLAIESYCTQQPNLEEVYMKITDGKIRVRN